MRNQSTARPIVQIFRTSRSNKEPSNRGLELVNYRIKSVSFSVVREPNAPDPRILEKPKAVVDLVRDGGLLADDGREHFEMLFLNSDLHVLGYHELAVGTLDSVLLSPREVYGAALRVLGTASIILVHNHPSGNVKPSSEDIALTKRIAAAGHLLDVPVKDHLIVANGSRAWFSFSDQGLIT